MSLLQKIKADQVAARKARSSVDAAILTTLIGEAEAVGKNGGNREVTDAEVVAMIKKFVKNLDETIRIAGDYRDGDACDRAWSEKQVLEQYLPKQLTEDELRMAMSELIANNGLSGAKAMGVLMKELKTNYEGLYDGALASKLAKELLA
jgi:uncharacterized protein YqeY